MIILKRPTTFLLLLVLGIWFNEMSADIQLNYHASITAQASTESLAPYMLGSWNYGCFAQGNGLWQEAGIFKPLDMHNKFSWSARVNYIAGATSKTSYLRWNNNNQTWDSNVAKMPVFRLSQFFCQLKYRSVFLTVGMKNSHSKIVDDHLSSGDFTRSNNAAPIPGVAVGFLDFQNIPYTNGWVQIDGEIMYGKMMDSNFKKAEFNFYSGLEAINLWYNYKRCYFRTNPDQKFHVTVGMQAAGLFAGTSFTYQSGKLSNIDHRGLKIKDAFQMFFPTEGGEAYYTGSHLGSWDLKATYRFHNDSKLSAYFEWPWEDGSGIGKMNGWDGLWGIKYQFANKGIINNAVVEYLDFTNQSGPIHFDPDDVEDNPLTGHAQGADNYYNNDFYGAYTNYGMGIGTPFLLSPIYNRNGMLSYLHNRARGFHAAIDGSPIDRLNYRFMISYESAGGAAQIPAYKKLHSTSAMMEFNTLPINKIPELEVGLRMAFDKGSLRGDNFGAQIQITYKGDFKLKKTTK